MIIPNELPQFIGETALLIVTGTRQAKIYRASNKVLEVIDEYKIPTPQYSDKEGYFQTRSKNGVMAAGSVLEDVDDQAKKTFLSELSKHLKQAGKIFSSSVVYVFAPSHIKNMVLDKLPSSLRKNVQFIFNGNFYNTTPLAIVGKIQAMADSNKIEFITSEAKKLLDKPHQSPSSATA
jgi:hypothetical protein